MKNQMLRFTRWFVNPHSWAYGLFWSWNLIFVAFMLLGFAPRLLPDMLTAVSTSTIPVVFLVFGMILAMIPVAAVVIGLAFLRRSPGRLFMLGYGVEGPLMFMLAVRFFLIREATLAVNVLMSIVVLGMATLLWQILDRNIDTRGARLTHLRVIGLTLFLLIVLYGSLWIAFYAVPFSAQVWNALGELLQGMWRSLLAFDWRNLATIQWAWVPFWVLGAMLAFYTATLFIGAPIAVPLIAIWAWQRGLRAFAQRYNARRALALAAIALALCAVLFVQTNQQPQRMAFALLKNPPANPAEAQSLRNQEETIRAGLLNAYLAPFRYISAVGEVRHVSSLYEWTLHLSPEQAASVEQFYDAVARPLLYEPVNAPKPDDKSEGRALREEPPEAAKLYKSFFDQRIVDGEHATIVNAVRSTWSFSQAEAALQAVDDQKIHLTRQEIAVKENGDWAEVELYEVYQNQTDQRQEVVYYFSLPESAVVTGLWLGNGEDRNTRFAYRVSPRGAAQALYRNEVRRNTDPALVEQIGPRQYRLRVFPVEPRRWLRDPTTDHSTLEAAPPLHMWLTFRVLARDNAWTLPRLAEKRNVYWDASSVRLVNSKPMDANAQTWLPSSVAATSRVTPAAHRVEFPTGETVMVRPVSANDLPRLSSNLRLAIVLDRSRSMNNSAADVKATLARLSQIAGANAEVYLTSSDYRGEAPSHIGMMQVNPDALTYFGGQNAGELLAQFDQLRAGQNYDAIFILTDGSGYELGASNVKVPIPNAPVWMIHLGGGLPLGYDDATLEAIQASGGGVTGNVEDALNRLAVALNSAALDVPAGATADWVDGYAWFVASTRAANMSTSASSDDDFAAFAARRLILAETQRQRATLGQLTTLDQLHAIAVKHGVVTPYSSMIVLINARQEQLLNQLETNGDRFQREVENIGDTVAQNPFTVTGVPEPEEWLLLALAVAMLIGYVYWTRRVPRRVRAD